jgi:Rieske Fe-S protein
MGDQTLGPVADPPRFDPQTTPLPRRRVLLLMGAGALAAGGGLGVLLEACAGPPITVRLDLDPAGLVPGTPTEVPFTLVTGTSSVAASAWLVKSTAGEITAFDPRCTHALCAYRWVADAGQFHCKCHEGIFSLDGRVVSGPPPRRLDQFPLRLVGDVIEVDVPSSFATPRESL